MSLWTTLAAHFKASPGKTGLLATLAVVLLVVVGRHAFKTPRSAEAAPLPDAVQTDGSLTAQADAQPQRRPPATPARRPRPPLPDLPDRPSRDPFEADWLNFAAVREWNVDETQDEEDASESALVLTLDMTLTGDAGDGHACAVINGRSVWVGGKIGGYVVESITPGEVVLSSGGGKRILLRMR